MKKLVLNILFVFVSITSFNVASAAVCCPAGTTGSGSCGSSCSGGTNSCSTDGATSVCCYVNECTNNEKIEEKAGYLSCSEYSLGTSICYSG